MTTVGEPLRKVFTLRRPIDLYRPYATTCQMQEIGERAQRLRGRQIVEVNLAPEGDASALTLHSLVPAFSGLALGIRWYTLGEDPAFMAIARKLEAGLRGEAVTLRVEEKDQYRRTSEAVAAQLVALRPDVLVIHGIGPAGAAASLTGSTVSTIWRCHSDLSAADPDTLAFVIPFLRAYQTLSFEAIGAVPSPARAGQRRVVIPGAIDPLTLRNQLIPRETARARLAGLGVDLGRPVIGQIAALPRWNAAGGAVEAYRMARDRVPGLQLVLAGPPPGPADPNAQLAVEELQRRTTDQPDIHLYLESGSRGALDQNAIQTGCDAVVSFARGEGWNIALAEAMWKRQATIGWDEAGARAVVQDTVNGFLVGSLAEGAERVVTLLQNPQLAAQIGATAHESITADALLPRLIADELAAFEGAFGHQARRVA